MMKLPLSATVFLITAYLTGAYEGSLSTGFTGTDRVDGNIFEIKTKDYPVTIERIDIHMASITQPIAVWYRPGDQSPVYVDTYQNALDTDVTGNGPNVLTALPSFPTPIVLPEGTTHTFYITASKNGVDALYYGTGTELGKTFSSDDFVEISEGYAMRYSFSSPAFPRQWNGVIHYSTTGPPPTPPPTTAGSPTNPTSPPTGQPTNNPTAGTPSPTISSTPSPISSVTPGPTSNATPSPISNGSPGPTSSATPDPTTNTGTSSSTSESPQPPPTVPQSTSTPTPKPTPLPIDTRSLTVSPTGSPVESTTPKPTAASPTAKPTDASSNGTKAVEYLVYVAALLVAFVI